MGTAKVASTTTALLLAALAFLSSPSPQLASAESLPSDLNDGGHHAASSSSDKKTTFRVFQTLPVEPNEMPPSELARMHRTIRATQAMVFSPSRRHYSSTAGGVGVTSSLPADDGVELALDIYTPSERREYLVRRGEHCHPRSANGGGGGNPGGNGNPLNPQDEDTSLQWYDVLSRYDSLMASAASSTSSKKGDSSSKEKSYDGVSSNQELERMAIELFKFCVLYNGDGHAFWGWEEQLLLPFRDVVSLQGNYGVVSMADSGVPSDVGVAAKAGGASQQTAAAAAADASEGAAVVVNGAVIAQSSASVNPAGASSRSYIHESFLSISPFTPATSVLSAMIRLLLETSDDVLAYTPLLLPRELHRLISEKEGGGAAGKKTDGIGSVVGSEKNEDKEGSDGGAWTLLRNSCIRLADMAMASGSSASAGASDPQLAGLAVDPSSSLSGLGSGDAFGALDRRMAARCPLSEGGYCCLAFLPEKGVNGEAINVNGEDGGMRVQPVMALRHPVGGRTSGEGEDAAEMPYKMHHAKKGEESAAKPLKLGGVPETDLPYISKVRLVKDNDASNVRASASSTTKFPTHPADTPNFFDILFENDCLPYRKECHRCLKDVANEAPVKLESDAADGSEGATVPQLTTNACSKCRLECPCYCDVLCKIRPPPKEVTRTYAVHPPRYRKEPGRLVPKIVHQTWFEPVTRDKYPNMSRLIESWKKSGWEYYFYDDDMAGDFLGTHFPPEVREAYESITPGAFKADLFRYCVLLIRGGVYADMDVLLETNLDDAVGNDIGFMTPIDEPGIEVGHRSCLWNGLIASAPGHPFLARTIEIVVNNIRNRFTSVDYDDMLCPNPILSVSHTVDTLFTCGPCILGAGINNLLGRHMQTEFEIGYVDVWQSERSSSSLMGKNVSGGNPGGGNVLPDDPRLLVPGRTVILRQDKNDMGAHRFTWADRHLIVAATDMPDYDDRPPTKEHYSKTHEKAGVYGMRKLYTDTRRANEEIRIVVVKS